MAAKLTKRLVICALGAAIAFPAMAALPTPPPECRSLRDSSGYNSGVSQGTAIVLQIWGSSYVNRDPTKCDTVVAPIVNTTIPRIVATVLRFDRSVYAQCRAEGLLDGAAYQFNLLCG
jgi:hypothetical protein